MKESNNLSSIEPKINFLDNSIIITKNSNSINVKNINTLNFNILSENNKLNTSYNQIYDNKVINFSEYDESISLSFSSNYPNYKESEEILLSMGFKKNYIKKIYYYYAPLNIDEAMNFMTKENNLYGHYFSENKQNKNICYFCNDLKEYHNVLNVNDIPDENENNSNIKFCTICQYENVFLDEKISLPCRHKFCKDCWYNYLKEKIVNNKLYSIKCMNYECSIKLTDEFIFQYISNNKPLYEKYLKFSNRLQIINDKNKKLCPFVDCEGFLLNPKINDNNDINNINFNVKCNFGHQFCYNCLKPWHSESCSNLNNNSLNDINIEINNKNKIKIKQCPKCLFKIEKIEGCNHMTCGLCGYQWCWLCMNQYNLDHYDRGKCKGLQYYNPDLNKRNDLLELNNFDYNYYKNQIFLKKIFYIIFNLMFLLFDYYNYEIDDLEYNKYYYQIKFFGLLIYFYLLIAFPIIIILFNTIILIFSRDKIYYIYYKIKISLKNNIRNFCRF